MSREMRVSGHSPAAQPPGVATAAFSATSTTRSASTSRAGSPSWSLPARRPAIARDIATREFGDVTEARSEIARVDHRRLTRERRQAWWETLRPGPRVLGARRSASSRGSAPSSCSCWR